MTSLTSDALDAEFRTLRRGLGIHSAGLGKILGPTLRQLAGVQPGDSDPVLRSKVHTWLAGKLTNLPPSDQLAAATALGLEPDATGVLLERIRWLAGRTACDERTARRRVDRALGRLAAQAVDVSAASDPDAYDVGGWYVKQSQTLLRLDLPAVEVVERRTIVATRDGLSTLTIAFSLPHATVDQQGSHDLAAELLYGGRLIRRERPAQTHFRYTMELPTALRAGESHEYGVVFRVPEHQKIRSHYVLFPLHHCESFELRIRFDPRAVPADIRRVSGVMPRMMDDPHMFGEPLATDRFGEVSVAFSRLHEGLGYGVRWSSTMVA